MQAELFPTLSDLVLTFSSFVSTPSHSFGTAMTLTLAPWIDKHTLGLGLVLVIRNSQLATRNSQLVTRTLPAPPRGDRRPRRVVYLRVVLFGLVGLVWLVDSQKENA